MRGRRSLVRRAAAVACALAVSVASAAAPASAIGGGGGGGSGGGGSGGDGSISAFARYIHFSGPGYVPGFPGSLGISFNLPECWYEGGLKWPELQRILYIYHHLPPDDQATFPAWPADFHVDDNSGSFWTPVCRDYSTAAATAYFNAHRDNYYIWEPNGDPGPPEAIDPVILAKADIEVAQLPKVTISSSPDANSGLPSFVTLPTWLWADDWGTGTSVTADIPGLTVTVNAKPRVLLVDPGTSSDRATVNANAGTVDGQPACDNLQNTQYTVQAQHPAPCTVTYSHSTADVGSYTITTKVVWDVTYTVNGVPKGPVPGTPEMTTPQDPIKVVVHEVQTPVTSG